MTIEVREFDYCFYHEKCPDGIGGAFAFYLYNPSCIFIACSSSEPPDIISLNLKDKAIVTVDYSFSACLTRRICSVAKKLVILDHHASSKREIEMMQKRPENLESLFDLTRSGAQIAWDWVHSKEGGGIPPPSFERLSIRGEICSDTAYPWFIKVIAARDLWIWDLFPLSKPIGKTLYHKGYYNWESMREFLELEKSDKEATEIMIEKFARIGEEKLEAEKIEIDRAVHNSLLVNFEGYRVRLAECQPHLRSDVGNELCRLYDCDFAAIWRYDIRSDQWWISLRGSGRRADIDLTDVIRKYQGGGHSKACGFAIHGPRSDRLTGKNTDRCAVGTIRDFFEIK